MKIRRETNDERFGQLVMDCRGHSSRAERVDTLAITRWSDVIHLDIGGGDEDMGVRMTSAQARQIGEALIAAAERIEADRGGDLA